MRRQGKNRITLFLVLTIVLSIIFGSKASGQVVYAEDFYVNVSVSMDDDAIAFYTVSMTLGPDTINVLRETGSALKIQLPKWASSIMVVSTDMPVLLLANGRRIRMHLEIGTDYDYLVAEIPAVDGGLLNATLKIGFVQRDNIKGSTVVFKLPILTGFNIIPKYVNFTFKTSGRIESYSQYLLYFNPIFKNNTPVGLWNIYFKPTAVSDISGSIFFSKPFDRCVIESIRREIMITEQLQVLVTDRLKVRYLGEEGTSEIFRVSLPAAISQRVKAKDILGPLQTYPATSIDNNVSVLIVYARYSLNSGQEYDAIMEYDIPIKNVVKNTSGNVVSILLKDLANYSDIVNAYSLNVKVKSGGDWRIMMDSTTVEVKKDEIFTISINNIMPSILVQPLSITFIHDQMEAGRGISIMLGLLTLAILMVFEIFGGKTIKAIEEIKEDKEVKSLIEKITEALNEKIDYESRLEEAKVKNAIGKLSLKEYKASTEEYERRITGADKRIVKAIEQISLKNQRVGEEVKRNYDIFEEVNADLKKMLDNTIERFKSGRITKSVFENLSKKYLKDNRKRREAAADDVYKSLEKLGL
ncbi:MAG: hypothetical protein QXT26_01555 [Thermoproteota archaeon]